MSARQRSTAFETKVSPISNREARRVALRAMKKLNGQQREEMMRQAHAWARTQGGQP